MTDVKSDHNIGRGLCKIRSIKELTQSTISQRTGLSINFLSRVENAKKGVSEGVAKRIADALQVPVSFLYLLGEESDDPFVCTLQNEVARSLKKAMADSNRKEEMVLNAETILN